ncbi:hypothetical protein L7F22_003298 [Adiantum nelumboides]|nr:hypothetical protein [Adiantum nelumboides]
MNAHFVNTFPQAQLGGGHHHYPLHTHAQGNMLSPFNASVGSSSSHSQLTTNGTSDSTKKRKGAPSVSTKMKKNPSIVKGKGKAKAISNEMSTQNASTKRKMTPMSAFRQTVNAAEESSSVTSSTNGSAAAKKKSNAEKFKRNSRACTYCQRLKMKCSGPTVDGPCERCRRTGRECMVQERAPRRPWTKKKDMQIQQLTDRLEEMESLLRNAFDKDANPDDAAAAMAAAAATVSNRADVQIAPERFTAGLQAGYNAQSLPSFLPTQQHAPHPEQLDSHLLPAENNKTTGPSPGAIANWLTLTNAPTTPSAAYELDLAYVDAHREQLPFVSTGKISANEAVELFHLCMNSCVLHTVILDPEWHTIPRVGDASPFLFAVVVLIGSTYHQERRSLRAELQVEMNVLIGQVITTGPKSIEIVQGFLLLYQWNIPSADPKDDRAWLLAGIGIRVATELQLHKTQSRTQIKEKGEKSSIETDRERINRERCWLMTFLVDRSLSIAVGRSWSISEKAELVRDSDKWSKQPASRAWDQGISAFADLLKTTSRQADVLHTAMASEGEQSSFFDCDTMMRIMNDELEHWRSRWLSRDFYAMTAELDKDAAERAVTRRAGSVSATNENSHNNQSSPSSSISVNTDALDVHLRTLYYITKQASLRYNFAVLVLNSFGLQYCAMRSDLQHARNFCLTHALRAAQGVLKAARNGMGNTMAFAPQTQYTILSFGVISLIKLTSLVEETVAERLLKEVQSCISFLESVAIASDHIAARLASLLRAMLRRREERKALRVKRKANDRLDSNGVDVKSDPKQVSNGEQRKTGDGERSNEEVDDDDDGEDTEASSNFAPGLDVHKLPQRSSRAVTPERSGFFASHPNSNNNMNTGHLLEQSSQHLRNQANEMVNGMQNWPTNDADLVNMLPSFDPDVESTLQSLGFMGNNGLGGWTQMSASEILDDSFWLRIPDKNGNGESDQIVQV